MKKMITILAVIICITTTLSICSYGQELRSVKGPYSKWGFVDDESEKEVISFIYDDARNFSEGLAAVKLNYRWGFIDKIGEEVIPFRYLDVGKFSEGLARVYYALHTYSTRYKWGFINKIGLLVISDGYDDAGDFSEGLARVKLNEKWGFINKVGTTIISFDYDDADDFSEGLARVKIKRNWIYIDKTGKEVNKDIPIVIRVADAYNENQVVLEQKPMGEFENCPYCGEEILAVATKCKHCGEWLDKTATSKVQFKPKKGSFCLEVQFKPLGDIVIQSNPNSIGIGSAGISAKCFASKKSELRIDLLFGFSQNTYTLLPPDSIEGTKEITRNPTTAFGLNLGFNRHFNGTERISPYIGFLLGFGVDITKVMIDNLGFTAGNNSSTTTRTFGMNFIIPTGFNWYIVNGLYLGAEVGLGLSFEKDFIEINLFAAPAIRLGWKF